MKKAIEEAALEKARVESAGALGRSLGTIYQEARGTVGAVRGSARYWGDYLDRIEIAVSFSPFEPGFGSLEYHLDCKAERPPAICSLAQAFSPSAVSEAGELLGKVGKLPPLEFRVTGMADKVWKAKRVALIYGGECGEGECNVDKQAIQIKSGIPVDSNEVLACLRGYCTLAASGVKGEGFKTVVRGVIANESAQQESRRAEVSLFAQLPSGDVMRSLWDSFMMTIGHR